MNEPLYTEQQEHPTQTEFTYTVSSYIIGKKTYSRTKSIWCDSRYIAAFLVNEWNRKAQLLARNYNDILWTYVLEP